MPAGTGRKGGRRQGAPLILAVQVGSLWTPGGQDVADPGAAPVWVAGGRGRA